MTLEDDLTLQRNNWKEHIRYKYSFYSKNIKKQRSDPGFPWPLVNGRSIKAKLKTLPFVEEIWMKLKGRESLGIEWLDAYTEQLFEVRCMLNDDVSKLLYDETIILRFLGAQKFIGPKLEFDEALTLIDKKVFTQGQFPNKYLGLPLFEFVLKLKAKDKNVLLNVIAADGFIELFNVYRQYFITRDLIDFIPSEGDVVFDCGACVGEIATLMAGFVGSKGEVHTFDPISLHTRFCRLQASINESLSHVFKINTVAVGNENITVEESEKIKTDQISPGDLPFGKFDILRLDDYVNKNAIDKVDFIKMDVEGAETDAIFGAKKILQEFKPKLAISTYHKSNDFWSIPLQIKKINPSYKFVFGHHSPIHWESVIYAY